MKKYIKISAIVLTGILLAISGNIQQAKAATSSNLFSTLLGKSETEVQARIDSVWTHFFTPGDISKYDADANEILHKVTSKDGKATGVYNLYDDSTRLITFVPNEEVHWPTAIVKRIAPWPANTCSASGT